MKKPKCKICGDTRKCNFYTSIGSYCKEHWKEKVRENRMANHEYYLAYDKARANRPDRVKARELYAQTEAGKEASRKARKAWEERNPIKKQANTMVGNAIRDGKLKIHPCEVCGENDKIHAHHDDYSKPLDVRWLCVKCHNEWHVKHGEAKNGK